MRILSGGSVSIHLQPDTPLAAVRSRVASQLGLSQFHEVKLFQGDEELKDGDCMQVQILAQSTSTMHLDMAGSDAASSHTTKTSEPAAVLQELGLLSGAGPIEVQAAIILSFPKVLAALRCQWPDPYDCEEEEFQWRFEAAREQGEAALAMLEEVRGLDAGQAAALLALLEECCLGRCYVVELDLTRLGQAFGRLCDDCRPFFPRLVEMLEHPRSDLAQMAASALSAAASSPNAKWMFQQTEAKRIHSWAASVIHDHPVMAFREPAIILFGATGTSESMAWLATEIGGCRSEPCIVDTFNFAEKLFLERQSACCSH